MPIFNLDQMNERKLLKEEQKEFIIGTIDFSDSEILEEKTIGSFKSSKLGNCNVLVYNGEGMYRPHVHIKSPIRIPGESHSFDCCVELLFATYFPHPPHDSFFRTNKQCKELNDWFKKTAKSDDGTIKTNWLIAIEKWKTYNGLSSKIDLSSIKQPNYETLNGKVVVDDEE